ncbi:hypothetical protein FF38_01464 [Lucilia cuprina]|uniref:MADF domain-containing protein n=1 Tax=Lucilia cuprina TaxID=7375 RepID=A0A0L0BNJ2_LUCCU|nr:hypothetical protein FF38_01464 [Lucilia cuprina]
MDVDEILIEEVRSWIILYDLGQVDYKNLKKKEYAWKEVAANVKMNEAECRKRWNWLRDSYKRCKRMQQIAFGSSAETPKKRWKYFEAMSFLDGVTSSRNTVVNTNNGDEEYPDIIDVDSADSYLSPAYQCSTSSCEKKYL